MNDLTPTDQILKSTRLDLIEDTTELQYLTLDISKKLSKETKRVRPFEAKLAKMAPFEAKLAKMADNQKSLLIYIDKAKNIKELTICIAKNHNLQLELRSLMQVAASTILAADWQAPSVSSSGYSQAGRRAGKIKLSYNDYTRDQNLDAGLYEQAFLKSYIDGIWKFPVHVQTTNSGMAAFTTIMLFLQAEHKLDGPVLVGSSTWFEAKQLLRDTLMNRFIEVPDDNTLEVIAAIKTHQPIACFFDSLGNTPEMVMPNLPVIIEAVKAIKRSDVTLVIDNTVMSIAFQPLNLVTKIASNLRLIVWESLNKYHQFGTDRVTGGVIWSVGPNTEKIFDYRGHGGTALSDIHALCLPSPERKFLQLRLQRINRNTALLAKHISNLIESHPNCPIASVQYPGLSSHPSFAYANSVGFTGPYFMLTPKPRFASVRAQEAIINRIMNSAKKQAVPLVYGTSFGLTPTRIYLTAIRSTVTKPFIRISVGMETRMEIEALMQVFDEALGKRY